MIRTPRRGRATVATRVVVLCAVLAWGLDSATDAAPLPGIDSVASATATAQPLDLPVDAVSVYQTGELTAPVRDAALAAASAAGAPAVVGRGFTVGLSRVRRGATIVQQSTGPGWAFPMAITSLPVEAIRAVMGRQIAGVVNGGAVVLNQLSASLRGAQEGDVLDMRAFNGATVSFTVGLVAPDDAVGGAEIVMSTDQAALLGGTLDTRVLIFGQFDRNLVELGLAKYGLTSNSTVRVRRSWDPADPDSTLSMARTKQLLGEFDIDYAHASTYGWTSMGATWRNTYLPPARELYPTGILAMCNKVIKDDLTAALAEVQSTYPSLVGAYTGIDVANTNAYGGCGTGTVRLARITQALGSVSRHSWGQPLDTSTVANCQGCVPKMDCRIVRIFRKHGFAWGGNFLTTDGMHFEWVGERRDTLQFPSKYCPNLPSSLPTERTGSPPPAPRNTLFADDGWSGE